MTDRDEVREGRWFTLREFLVVLGLIGLAIALPFDRPVIDVPAQPEELHRQSPGSPQSESAYLERHPKRFDTTRKPEPACAADRRTAATATEIEGDPPQTPIKPR
jgi:Tfp pilus assembly major pilin PilA